LVQKDVLQLEPNKKSQASTKNPEVPIPLAHKTAITIPIPKIIPKKVAILPSNLISLLPEINPHKSKATKTTTKAILKNNIKFSTIIFGKTAETKIKPITKETKALSCVFLSPRIFVFSIIPKQISL